MKKKLSNIQRITIVMEFYHQRGCNSERVNKLYRKIINNVENNSNS